MLGLYNPQGYIVRISEEALIQICLSGLEAYSVHHLRGGARLRLETYGLLWGHETLQPDGRTSYSVDTVSVDTSARMDHAEVLPRVSALELKRDLMTSFWPHLEFLGDFHSHPYPDTAGVVEERLYRFSDNDRDAIEGSPDLWRRHGYRVGLVLTVGALKRASRRPHRWLDSGTVEFTLGNYRLWLKAYVTYEEEAGGLKLTTDDEPNLALDCPALMGLRREHTPFGRVQADSPGDRHRAGRIDMSAAARMEHLGR
ncbi:MAG: hypothetical protein ACM3XM_13550 [Mycobacterium leprae]